MVNCFVTNLPAFHLQIIVLFLCQQACEHESFLCELLWPNSKFSFSVLSKVAGCRVKVASYLVSIGQPLCLEFLYTWCFLNKISPDRLLTLTTQPSTSKLSDNPAFTSSCQEKVRLPCSCFCLLTQCSS